MLNMITKQALVKVRFQKKYDFLNIQMFEKMDVWKRTISLEYELSKCCFAMS